MRIRIFASALVLGALVAAPAFAATAQGPHNAAHARAEGKNGKRFPISAAEFKAKVDQRMAHARAHMEERAARLPVAEAKELRAKFEAAAKNVDAELAKAIADGTVTKDEARAVRAASPHPRRHAHHKKHGDKSKR